MPKAQVLVTLTAEALIEVPEGADVETFCREQLSLDWGPVRVGQVLQPPSIVVPEPAPEPAEEAPAVADQEPAHAGAAEPAAFAELPAEPAPIEPAVEAAPVEALPAGEPVEAFVESRAEEPAETPAAAVAEEPSPVAAAAASPADSAELVELFNDPIYRDVIRSAVRDRAARLLEDVVNQVVAELEPLLQRHLSRQTRGAQ